MPQPVSSNSGRKSFMNETPAWINPSILAPLNAVHEQLTQKCMAAQIRRDQVALLTLDLPVRTSFCEFDITVFGVNMPAILLRVRVNQPPDFGLSHLPKSFWFGGDLLGNKKWVCLCL